MPLPRFDKLDDDRREEILDTAARHFAADGYDSTSVNRILADCGLSKGAVYYYFSDKADLFATVVEYAAAVVLDGWDTEIDGLEADTFWPTLETLYLRQIAGYRDRPHLWRVAKQAAEAAAHPTDGPRIVERLQPLAELLQRLLGRALHLGVLRDDLPVDLVIAMIGGLDDAIDGWFLAHPEAHDAPDIARRAFSALRAVAAREES